MAGQRITMRPLSKCAAFLTLLSCLASCKTPHVESSEALNNASNQRPNIFPVVTDDLKAKHDFCQMIPQNSSDYFRKIPGGGEVPLECVQPEKVYEMYKSRRNP